MFYTARQKSDAFIRRQNQTVFAWCTVNLCQAILSAKKTGWLYQSSNMPLSLSKSLCVQEEDHMTYNYYTTGCTSTYSLKPKFHYVNFATKCLRLSWFVSAHFVADFPRALYNGLNSIKATQTGLSQTLSQPSRHVEMVCVRDFHNSCPRLSLQWSFGESRRNGIWALASKSKRTTQRSRTLTQ